MGAAKQYGYDMITRQGSTVGASGGWNFWEILKKSKKALSATFCGEKIFEKKSFLRWLENEKTLSAMF